MLSRIFVMRTRTNFFALRSSRSLAKGMDMIPSVAMMMAIHRTNVASSGYSMRRATGSANTIIKVEIRTLTTRTALKMRL